MLLEGESAEGNTILFFFSFFFFTLLYGFRSISRIDPSGFPFPTLSRLFIFFFFYDFEDLEIFSPSSPSPSPFFLAKERGKRETSVGRVETSRIFRRTRGLLERVGGVRRVGRAKCKGARGRESPWRYYVQVHFDVNRFGKLVKISVAAGGYGEDGKAEGGGWRGGAAGGAGDGVRKLFRRVHFLSA